MHFQVTGSTKISGIGLRGVCMTAEWNELPENNESALNPTIRKLVDAQIYPLSLHKHAANPGDALYHKAVLHQHPISCLTPKADTTTDADN